MGCVSTKQFEEYKNETDQHIKDLESKNTKLETILDSTVSNLVEKAYIDFSSFKTSMIISRNIIDRRLAVLENKVCK